MDTDIRDPSVIEMRNGKLLRSDDPDTFVWSRVIALRRLQDVSYQAAPVPIVYVAEAKLLGTPGANAIARTVVVAVIDIDPE